jgi:hypothetical protein
MERALLLHGPRPYPERTVVFRYPRAAILAKSDLSRPLKQGRQNMDAKK